MAMLLKKSHKIKASYYVWFLGVQETAQLDGDFISTYLIPQLAIQRRVQDPIKVTLQISFKGLKIIQGSKKHFISDFEIIRSTVVSDIVACSIYDENKKHSVHYVYRCDSKSTAFALHEHLMTFISRPENQKRIEMESRHLRQMQLNKSLNRTFDSSLGSSDTGTSTRESECSEDHSNAAIIFKNNRSSPLFESLTEELKTRFQQGPLLLPPKDYDTIHRSRGNLLEANMRRCQNRNIVGADASKISRIEEHEKRIENNSTKRRETINGQRNISKDEIEFNIKKQFREKLILKSPSTGSGSYNERYENRSIGLHQDSSVDLNKTRHNKSFQKNENNYESENADAYLHAYCDNQRKPFMSSDKYKFLEKEHGGSNKFYDESNFTELKKLNHRPPMESYGKLKEDFVFDNRANSNLLKHKDFKIRKNFAQTPNDYINKISHPDGYFDFNAQSSNMPLKKRNETNYKFCNRVGLAAIDY